MAQNTHLDPSSSISYNFDLEALSSNSFDKLSNLSQNQKDKALSIFKKLQPLYTSDNPKMETFEDLFAFFYKRSNPTTLKMSPETTDLLKAVVEGCSMSEIEAFNRLKEASNQEGPESRDYQTARAIYDVQLNQWVLGVIQEQKSKKEPVSLQNRVTQEMSEVKLSLFERVLHFLFGYKTTTMRMLDFKMENIEPFVLKNFAEKLVNHDHLKGSLDRVSRQTLPPELDLMTLKPVIEWLQEGAPIPSADESKRQEILRNFVDHTNAVIGIYKDGIQINIPPELEERGLQLFSELTRKYLANVPEEVQTIDDIRAWFSMPSSHHLTKPTNEWRYIEIYREFDAQLHESPVEKREVVQQTEKKETGKSVSFERLSAFKIWDQLEPKEQEFALFKFNQLSPTPLKTIAEVEDYCMQQPKERSKEMAAVLEDVLAQQEIRQGFETIAYMEARGG